MPASSDWSCCGGLLSETPMAAITISHYFPPPWAPQLTLPLAIPAGRALSCPSSIWSYLRAPFSRSHPTQASAAGASVGNIDHLPLLHRILLPSPSLNWVPSGCATRMGLLQGHWQADAIIENTVWDALSPFCLRD